MPTIRKKAGPWNPQKASAYVRKSVLKGGGELKKLIQSAPRMRNTTPVPMGPLVQKKGKFKGSTLKRGGKIKRNGNN